MKKKYNFLLEAYCLMDNHVHLLINDNGNDISKIVKSINISYAYYFNRVYKRVGHLFQDRFKSEVIHDNTNFLCVSAYIHNNPVKAGIVKAPEEYKWSSFNSILGKAVSRQELVDRERLLSMFSQSLGLAVNEYYSYVRRYEQEMEMLDVEEDKLVYTSLNSNYISSYKDAERVLSRELEQHGKTREDLEIDRVLRKEVITMLRKNSSLTLKEIGGLCGGLSQSMICKILKQ